MVLKFLKENDGSFGILFSGIQTIVLTISAILVIWSLNQNAKLKIADNSWSIVNQAMNFNSALWGNREAIEVWYSFGVNFDNLDRADQLRYREMLIQWLMFHENIFLQYEDGLVDENVYKVWTQELEWTVNNHNIGVIGSDPRTFFVEGFGDLIVQYDRRRGGDAGERQAPK